MANRGNQHRVNVTVQKAVAPLKYYRVEREDGFTGKDKYVRFWRGVGVLDLFAIFLERSDWIDQVEGTLVQHSGEPFENYVAYWKRRGFKLVEINAEDAAALREKADVERKKFEEVDLAKQRAKQKAKTEDREEEAEADALAAEANAMQKLGLTDPDDDDLSDVPKRGESAPNPDAGDGGDGGPPPADAPPHLLQGDGSGEGDKPPAEGGDAANPGPDAAT